MLQEMSQDTGAQFWKDMEAVLKHLYRILCVCILNCVQLFAIPWSVAHQAPLFMEFFQARILEWIAFPKECRQGTIVPPGKPYL